MYTSILHSLVQFDCVQSCILTQSVDKCDSMFTSPPHFLSHSPYLTIISNNRLDYCTKYSELKCSGEGRFPYFILAAATAFRILISD